MKEITLTNNGMKTQLDDDDYEHFKRWEWEAERQPDGRWYAVRFEMRNGRRVAIYLHNEVWRRAHLQ